MNRVPVGDHGLRIAVLVNDFGAVNIDAELVVGVDDDMMSLANGCVLREIRDDHVEAVERVLDTPDRPDHLVLEASGVADPMGSTPRSPIPATVTASASTASPVWSTQSRSSATSMGLRVVRAGLDRRAGGDGAQAAARRDLPTEGVRAGGRGP